MICAVTYDSCHQNNPLSSLKQPWCEWFSKDPYFSKEDTNPFKVFLLCYFFESFLSLPSCLENNTNVSFGDRVCKYALSPKAGYFILNCFVVFKDVRFCLNLMIFNVESNSSFHSNMMIFWGVLLQSYGHLIY